MIAGRVIVTDPLGWKKTDSTRPRVVIQCMTDGIRVLRATEPSEVKDVMEAAASQAYNACTPTAVLLAQRLIGTKVFVK